MHPAGERHIEVDWVHIAGIIATSVVVGPPGTSDPVKLRLPAKTGDANTAHNTRLVIDRKANLFIEYLLFNKNSLLDDFIVRRAKLKVKKKNQEEKPIVLYLKLSKIRVHIAS
jgi:hypothetical protein